MNPETGELHCDICNSLVKRVLASGETGDENTRRARREVQGSVVGEGRAREVYGRGAGGTREVEAFLPVMVVVVSGAGCGHHEQLQALYL